MKTIKTLAFMFVALISVVASSNSAFAVANECDAAAAIYNRPGSGCTCTPDAYVGNNIYWCTGPNGASWALAVGSTGQCQAFPLES